MTRRNLAGVVVVLGICLALLAPNPLVLAVAAGTILAGAVAYYRR